MPSLSSTLANTAARCPDAVALVFGGRRSTYAELAAEVERVASAIAARGVGRGDRVLLIGGNSDAFVVAAYAILRAGGILVPANPRSAPPELAYLIDDCAATLVLASPDLAALAGQGVVLSKTTPTILAVGAGTEFENLLEDAASAPLAGWPAEDDDALLIYTSGTTGRPKGALFDHHRSLWVGVNMGTVYGIHEGDRILHVAPLYHAAELCLMLFPGTMNAATHVVMPAFDPTAVARTMAEERITVFFGVPTMYQFLLTVPELATLDLSHWRVGMFGAAPMPSSVVSRLVEALPSVELYQLCGQTEAGPGGIYSGPEDVRLRPDASGRYALPNTEVRVVDQNGNQVAPGTVGELLLRGETVMKRYWNKPEETAKTLVDGWVHTGDLALLDEDGYMTLVDRLKDMIITGGRNVYSVEVENALMAFPDFAEVAIVGIPNELYGESILAVAVAKPGTEPTLESLRAWSRDQIADYKVPHQLVFHAIPRNPSGKIQKHILKQELAADGVLV